MEGRVRGDGLRRQTPVAERAAVEAERVAGPGLGFPDRPKLVREVGRSEQHGPVDPSRELAVPGEQPTTLRGGAPHDLCIVEVPNVLGVVPEEP